MKLDTALNNFLRSRDDNYRFPAGGNHAILSSTEVALVEALESVEKTSDEKIQVLHEQLEWTECYDVLILGVRLAILSVRQHNTARFRQGLLFLFAGARKVDDRDVLRACSIFENCANQLEVEFETEAFQILPPGHLGKFCPTVSAFFRRSEEMKAIQVMGIQEIDEEGLLGFV